MSSQVATCIFEYGGKGRRISFPVSTSLDEVLQLVATRWKISVPIELVYVDPATGDEMFLDVDDDLPSLFSQNYKWKVFVAALSPVNTVATTTAATISNTPGQVVPPSTASGGSAGAAAHADDSYDKSLQCKKDKCTGSVAVTAGDIYDKTLARKKDKWIKLIPNDWECKTKVQTHPFFISYRQASEAAFAKSLFERMKINLLEAYTGSVLPEESRLDGRHAFLDAECLSYAEEWGINFMSGLFHSKVIILLCSDESMKRMLEADKKPDNCLLEWELALQMKKEKGHDILPVLLSCREDGTRANGKKAKVLVDFSTFDQSKFPAEPHAHPLSPGLQTVAETVKMILELNGPKANPETDVMRIVTEAREVYSRRKAELKTPSPSQDISLSRSSSAELKKWLSPLSEDMDLEREALLTNVLSGSRQWLLKRVFKFLSPDDPSVANTNRVMWLKGVAGVGKSVMAAMVSRALQAQGMLGGLFFCKHDDKRRSSARNLVLTLVFGLARFLQYGEILLQVKSDYPDILSKSVFEMMKVLLVQPLKKVVEAKKLDIPVVLVVDALDECSVIGKRNEILAVFQELNRLLPDNVKMLVTGRPEVDIVKAFEKIPFDEIEPTAEENTQDQIDFTRNYLRSLGAKQSMVEEGSEILVSKSAGIFVWLVTACTYLKNSHAEEFTIEQIKDLPEGDKMDGSIDLMYDRIFAAILETVKEGHLETLLHTVLSTIVLAYEPLTAVAIVSLLDEEEPENVMKCIRMLDSILVLDGSTKKIRIFHKSVKDYLTTPERCKLSVQIDVKCSHSEFARLCISAMDKNLKFNMCDLPFSDFHSEIPDFDEKVRKGIPEHVRYAVKHFWKHCSSDIEKNVQEGGDGDGDDNEKWFDAEDNSSLIQPGTMILPPHNFEKAAKDLQEYEIEKPVATTPSYLVDLALSAELEEFLVQHGHHYLEACSLIDSLSLVIPAMIRLQTLFPEKKQLHTLMEDMKRVVQKFLIPLKASALQVYFTAVPFSPSDSEFFKTFVRNVPASVRCPKVVKGQPKSWPSCLNILEGHSLAVTSAAFSPDGQFVVSGSRDRTVRIWNASTGQELHKLEGHSDSVSSAAFSPDGQLVVSGSADKTVRIWNASTGQELDKLVGHTNWVTAAAFSPDSQFVVSGSLDKTVRIWNASTGQELHKLEGHSDCVYSAAFSPDCQFVVSGSEDKTVRIWNASTGQELHKLEGHTHFVSSAAFSSDGQLVVSGSADKTVRIWNASTGQELHKLEGHTDHVYTAAFSPDGQFVVSGGGQIFLYVSGRDTTVRIWNASTGQELRKLKGHTRDVFSAAFSPDGQFVVSGSRDKTVRIWNASTGQELHRLDGFSFTKHHGFSADGQCVFLKDRNGKRIFVKLRTALPVDRSEITLTGPCLAHNFSARNLSGERLQSEEGVLESVISDGVWFNFNVTKVCIWLPPEFRGRFQLLSSRNMFTLGQGFSSAIQF